MWRSNLGQLPSGKLRKEAEPAIRAVRCAGVKLPRICPQELQMSVAYTCMLFGALVAPEAAPPSGRFTVNSDPLLLGFVSQGFVYAFKRETPGKESGTLPHFLVRTRLAFSGGRKAEIEQFPFRQPVV